MKYKSVVATGRGSIDHLKIVENDLREPSTGEARVRVLAVGVCQDDIATRVGNRPFLPKIPFVPGYDIVGIVDAVGDGAAGLSIGDRVAALTGVGGYAEFVYLPASKLVPVPEFLDPAKVATLILNYVVA